MIQPGQRAVNRYTGTTVILSRLLEGAYDENNRWVEGGYSAPRNILATPIPKSVGDQSAVSGERLDATLVGERKPSHMRFTTKIPIHINDLITVYDTTYKIIHKSSFEAAGHFGTVGAKLFNTEVSL